METVTLQTVMAYGRKPHNSIINVYQQISTLLTWQSTVHGPPQDGLKIGTETCMGQVFKCFYCKF